MPALLFLVAGVVVVTLALDPLGDRDELGKTVLVALTWTGNLPFGHASDATFHLWTLATEEQFYLVWPALLAARLRARPGAARPSWRWPPRACSPASHAGLAVRVTRTSPTRCRRRGRSAS